MPRFHYTIRGAIDVPEGSKLEGNSIVLPDGATIKAWETFEYHSAEGDEPVDKTLDELMEMGCFYDGDTAHMQEVEETDQMWPIPK